MGSDVASAKHLSREAVPSEQGSTWHKLSLYKDKLCVRLKKSDSHQHTCNYPKFALGQPEIPSYNFCSAVCSTSVCSSSTADILNSGKTPSAGQKFFCASQTWTMQQWVQTTWRTPSTGQLFIVLMISWTLKKVVGNKRRGTIKPRFCLQQFWHKSAQAAVYSPLENRTKTTSKRFFNHSIYSTFLNVLIKWILKLCWGIWSSTRTPKCHT